MVATKQPSVIGQRMGKIDGQDKVEGLARFGADIHLPGMLCGKVLRSPHAHARILKIDISKAEALPGVMGVVTNADFPDIPKGTTIQNGHMTINVQQLNRQVMAREKALYAGHPVAAVAAISPEAAEEALNLIEVDYEVLPPVLDCIEAMKADAPLLHGDMYTRTLGERPEKPSNVALHLEMGRGDVEQGFAQADVVIERSYRTQMVHQGYIEPEAETAWVQPDGQVTIWADTQGSFSHRNQTAGLFQMPFSRIKVTPMEVGGGFGGKSWLRVSPICVALSQKAGRPVKIVLTREEVLRATGPGSPTATKVKVGATKDGQITAIKAEMAYDAGAFPGSPLAGGTLSGFAHYRTSNLKIDGYDVVTNKPRVQAYRAPGATAASFAVESVMDEMAQALDMDPLELRAKNATREGDRLPNDRTLNRVGLEAVLEKVRSSPAWAAPFNGKNRGRGLALGFWIGGTGISSCHLSFSNDGSINVVVGSVDLSATRTSFVQMVAEEFGIPPNQVRVVTGDTDGVAHTDNTGGSRITYSMGTAIHLACQDALRQLNERASAQLNVSPEVIDYAAGTFQARDIPDRSVTLAELSLTGIHSGDMVIGHGVASRLQNAPSFAAHIADVEVDQETGKVHLINYTTFQDVGRAINPDQVEGQMQGGAAQGLGWALSEGYQYDDKGILINASLLDYRLPTALDLPMIRTEIVEVAASDGPYGVRGVGEVPIVPPPAAVANAIARATGARIRELPMNPERVFWALRAQEEKGEVPGPVLHFAKLVDGASTERGGLGADEVETPE